MPYIEFINNNNNNDDIIILRVIYLLLVPQSSFNKHQANTQYFTSHIG